jgi:uncharacterized ubiquitin-like protein YukD
MARQVLLGGDGTTGENGATHNSKANANFEELYTNVGTAQSTADTANSAVSAHVSDSSAAHAATAISFAPGSSGLSATDVNAAIEELAGSSGVGDASETVKGIIEIATSSEAIAGTDAVRAIVPTTLKAKLSSTDTKTTDFATVSTDNQKLLVLNSATAKTITVDQLAAGTYQSFLNIGLGQWNFTAGSGVTIYGAGTSSPGGEVNTVTLWWVSLTDVYVMSGVSNTVSSLAVTGTLAIRAGLSTGTIAKVGGVIYNSVTQAGNVGTGEDDLFLYEIPANTLAADKATIVAFAAGTFAANANNKRIKVKFGGTNIYDTTALALNAGDWYIECQIMRTAGSTQKCITTFRSSNATLTTAVDYATGALDLSTPLELKITAEATSNNDVVGEMFRVRFEPNE